MSSRALRRLQQQKIELPGGDDGGREEQEEKGEEVEEEVVQVVKKKNKKKNNKVGNIFDLLADEDADDDITIQHDEEEEEEVKDNDDIKENGTSPTTNNNTSTKSKKKKKKNKKGKSNNNKPDDELDELDQTVEEINKISVGSLEDVDDQPDGVERRSNTTQSSVFKRKSILLVDPRNLSIQNEMKKRFGASVVNANNRRHNPHNRRFKRTTCLVTPQDNWPPFTKVGITMNQVKSDNSSSSISTFHFEHQEIYRNVQFKFYDCLESMDHNNIMALLNAHPYHVDSMLQLSEICRMNEDHRMAGELIERCLFVFECAFHTLFNITQGTCRLDYKRAENRPFFLALYRHISYIGDKACYRTALEFCKILLGLDPVGDPLGVFLMLDYYSLKSDEYHYLIQVYEDYNDTRNLQLLPNFSYSIALAHFHVGNVEQANKMLREALLTFPSLLVELTEKIGVDTDNSIRTHPFFDPVTYLKQSPPLNQVIALYVGRCHSIWKQPEVLDWLIENAKFVVDHFDDFKREVDNGDNRRSTCFRFSPQNVLRHIMTSDIKEAIEKLPIEVRGQSVMTHDPLPPDNSVIGYQRPDRNNVRGDGSQQNMLSLFLQSLMPSYNQAGQLQNPIAGIGMDEPQPQPQGAQPQPQGAQANDPGVANVQTGAQRLMDVMRELISTMTYRNDGVGEDGEVLDENRYQDEEWE